MSSVPGICDGIDVAHPAFDVTPNKLVHAIITEKGIVRPPFQRKFKKAVLMKVFNSLIHHG